MGKNQRIAATGLLHDMSKNMQTLDPQMELPATDTTENYAAAQQ